MTLHELQAHLEMGDVSVIATLPREAQEQARTFAAHLHNPFAKPQAIEAILRLAQVHHTRRVLFLAANPEGTGKLDLTAEYAQAQRCLEGVTSYQLTSRFATNAGEFMTALLDAHPHILHFAGHGETDGIMLHGAAGGYELATAEALRTLFQFAATQGVRPELVILNACYSQGQAEAISACVPLVAGTTRALQDKHAIAFTHGFYLALARGIDYMGALDAGEAMAAMAGAPAGTFTRLLMQV
jgi:hypothetical protein